MLGKLGNRPTFSDCCLKSVQINKDYNFKYYKNRLTVSIFMNLRRILIKWCVFIISSSILNLIMKIVF